MAVQLVDTVRDDYLRRLTDDTGIFQHTKFGVPDRSKGYTTDDNARALIAAVLLYKERQDSAALDLIHTYLSFVHHAQHDRGNFRNFMDYNRNFLEERGSEDCQGRTVWALGFAVSEPTVPDNLQNTCRYLIHEALPQLAELRSPRAIGYATVGLSMLLETPGALDYAFPYPHEEEGGGSFLSYDEIASLVESWGQRLHDQYHQYRRDDWHWFEDSMTYGNAMLPWALFKAAALTGRTDLHATARESLAFLIRHTFAPEGYFRPIGSSGWFERGKEKALYDEQPIEACETMLALLEAYHITGSQQYKDCASACHDWYIGRNSLGVSLIDPQTGACYDGIHPSGLNLNQGSESIISYSIARSVIKGE
ncbi:glycosyltransferase [Paenibacillus sp. 1P07SE]|uniref:glycosyltransferase n=1 Tax=Paenibacillus sp. 1P07SE TaxID=3132209 RepID=UPI0039A67DF3